MKKFFNNGAAFRPNFSKFQKLTDKKQLEVGMVLIDYRMYKRTVLAFNDTHIWLGHKYNKQPMRVTGKEHPIDDFIKKFPNWIFEK